MNYQFVFSESSFLELFDWIAVLNSAFRVVKTFLRVIELVSDGLLLLLSLAIVLVASIILERGAEFSATYYDYTTVKAFYTIETLYKTFSILVCFSWL